MSASLHIMLRGVAIGAVVGVASGADVPRTKIRDRGDNVVNLSQGKTCLSCHQPAVGFDFVCEKGHGCAPIPFNDQAIHALQQADARCARK
jgi:hypothetical protein